jgi:aerobic-type carbon monoxide dehydrogenase small subunit (CoxS/CutS family)
LKLSLTVNGAPVEIEARPDDMLLGILRRELGLTSVRETCGVGVCGACTVLLDGETVSACLVLAPLVEGRAVTTAESLPEIDPVPRAFAEARAYQCGYCTPGFLLATKRLLEENPSPTVEEIKLALAGNLCRCGSYLKIIDAVKRAREERAWTSSAGSGSTGA